MAATIATSNEAVEVCSRCKGVGYYLLDVPFGHADFGQLITCRCRAFEKQQQRRQRLVEMSNLGPFQGKTFDNFDTSIKGVSRACARARHFAQQPEGWLVLMGNYGCGKTHLAAAIANDVLQNHYISVLFAVVPDLLDHLRGTFGPSSEVAYDERFEQIRGAHLLILDDFGTENATPWAREKVYQIFNHRYNYRLPTVITSNRDPKEIDQRIFSRMSDRELCDEITIIDAGDYRSRLPNQRFVQQQQQQEPKRRAPRRESHRG